MTCNRCEGNYKIDLGNGESRTRELEGGECPVCDSDPNGEHRDYFIDYLGWVECEKCESITETGECEECDED